MMQLMKKWTACALTVLSALALTACHAASGREAVTVPASMDTDATQEITFWAKNDTNKAQVQVYQDAITSFEKLYPNITVNLRLYTDYSKIYNDVITNIATGTTPDVCITYPDHIATYLTGVNVVAPLDDLMTDAQYGFGGSALKFDGPAAEEVVPAYLEEGVLQGHQYALPFMRSTEALYINKTYVEKLGYTIPDVVTWDFIWEVSEAATKKNTDGTYAVNGQNVMIPFIYKSTDNMMIQMLRQLDAPYSTDSGEIGIFNDTTGSLLQEIGSHVPSGAFSTFKLSGYPANFLAAGQCLFAIDSTAGSTWMGADAPLTDIAEENKVDFETVVRSVPQFDEGHLQMISQGPSICLFNHGDDQRTLAAWLFAQYLLTDEVQIGYAETEGYIPVTKKAQQSAQYQDYLAKAGTDDSLHYQTKLDATNLLLQHIDDTFVTPVFNGSASLRVAAGQLIEGTVKSAKRKKPVDEAFLAGLYDETASLYRLDQIERQNAKQLGQTDLGPLPGGAKALLLTLAAAWIGIAAVFFKRKFAGQASK